MVVINVQLLLYILQDFADIFASIFFFIPKWALGKDFDYTKFDFHSDYQKLVTALREKLDATKTDLTEYKNLGNKLMLITGSVDVLISPLDGKQYFDGVLKTMGGLEKVDEFFRYFHIPGLGHGSGGVGFQEIGNLGGIPNVPIDEEHDVLCSMMAWVEKGVAPERLLPVAFVDGKFTNPVSHERPIYPYPYETEYVGGDIKDVGSFKKKLSNGIY